MSFSLPQYNPPDFNRPNLLDSPTAVFKKVLKSGVAPDNYHATSIHPEYIQIKKGHWHLLKESRMDCVVVLEDTGELSVKEFRHLKPGELVACGRRENGEDGIFVHTEPFDFKKESFQKFAFRTRITRETSFSIDYDQLYDLLEFERQNGFIIWVLGPAVVFDKDARDSFIELIGGDYVHGLLAGNALSVHDIEASLFSTALGQEIYSKQTVDLGHYNHLDAINKIRSIGSIEKAINHGTIKDGVMQAAIQKKIPFVLAGSIRDDGPLPEVIRDVYEAQDRMRSLVCQSTTVIALATQLHAIATGNMVPSYKVVDKEQVRPVYFYTVDMSEFAASKLANRGSLAARSILTNVQDFVVTVARGLRRRRCQ